MVLAIPKETFMTEGVTTQETAEPAKEVLSQSSDKDYNFRRLEEAKEKEREQRIRAEMQAEALQKEIQEIKEYLKPKEKDPFDDDDEFIDPELKTRLNAKLAKERESLKREAERIARDTYSNIQKEKDEAEQKNFLKRLKEKYPDFDEVVNEQSIAEFHKKDPDAMETILDIEDEYKRRERAYKKMKSFKESTPEPSVKEVVAKNQKNPYHVPNTSAPTSNAIDFDVRSKEARESAYAALKAAQRRPIESRRPFS